MKDFKGYKKDNPYHVWAYRRDGTKFVAHFKNKAEATRWSKVTHSRLGNVTTASKSRPKRKASGGLWNIPKGRGGFW
jgi:hypothetical protein